MVETVQLSPPAPGPTAALLSVHDRLRQAGLEVLLPSDEAYAARQESYFSKTASQLVPACIVRPKSAPEVSSVIRTLLSGEGHRFAIRSGGHAPNAGASNIDGGITLDLGRLNWTRVVSPPGGKENGVNEQAEVDIGPGARWADVYTTLHPHGLAVAGGREGGVGVGGLVLGGGNTYFTASRGFACDNVVAFEVVLAPHGDIVTATADNSYADLFWALKGGGNNFGVVTNFRMRALRGRNTVWGGLTVMPWEVKDLAAEALTEFTGRVHEDVDANLMLFYAYRDMGQVGIIAVYAQVAGVERAPAYDKWLALPSLHTDVKMTSLAEIAANNTVPLGYFSIWFTATFKNDARIVSHAGSLHDKLVAALKTDVAPDGDFWALCLFQPLPKICSAGTNHDNALGLPSEHDALVLQTTVMVRTPEQAELAYPRCRSFLAAVREFASAPEIDGNLAWEYLNYADASQDPLRSYGEANVRRLKAVARKYDPQEAFQKLCVGGFKIGKVES